MYSFLLAAIVNQYEEQPFVTAEEQQLCTALVALPEQSYSVQPLTFHIDLRLLQRDYIEVTNVPGGVLCSQRFFALLNRAKADVFTFPTLLRDQDTGQEITSPYLFGTFRQYDQVIDWNQSESWVDTETEHGGHYMTKIVLLEEFEKQQIPIFRLERTLLTLVDEHLVTKLEQEKLVGLAFAPLNAIYSPHQGIRMLELERILRKRPKNAKRWLELGNIQISLYRFQDALAALDYALTLDSGIGRAWYLHGLALSRLGRQQEALESYQKAARLNELGAWLRVSNLLRQFGKAEEALTLIEQFRGSIWESGRPFWCELGETYIALGHDKEALEAFERAISILGAGKDIAFRGKGDVLFRLGRYEEALVAYRTGLEPHSLDLDSKIRDLRQGEVKALHALGRLEEAAIAEQKLQDLENEREFRMHIRPL